MYLHKPEEYKKKVQDYVKKYATEEALREQEAQEAAHLSSDSESSMSDFSEDEAHDMELWASNFSSVHLHAATWCRHQIKQSFLKACRNVG